MAEAAGEAPLSSRATAGRGSRTPEPDRDRRPDREASRVLREALRGGSSRITVEPPLIVYREPGVYTEEVWELYYGK